MLFESKKRNPPNESAGPGCGLELELFLALFGTAFLVLAEDRMLATVVAKVLSAGAREFRFSADVVRDGVHNTGGVDVETLEELHQPVSVLSSVEDEVETFQRHFLAGDAVDVQLHDPGAVGILVGQGDAGVSVCVHVCTPSV